MRAIVSSAASPAVRTLAGSVATSRRAILLIGALSVAVVLAHVPYLQQPPDDLDSLNFALGVRDFDVARHQPHPPGAPVYIGLGRGALMLAKALRLAPHPLAGLESVALTLLAALSSGVLLFALWRLFASLAPAGPTAAIGALLAVASPLAWVLAARPLSDVPGLAAAVIAQAALLGGGRRKLLAGAALAGLSSGIRLQIGALTFPLLAFRLIEEWRGGRRRAAAAAAIAWGGAVAFWSFVLVFDAGSPAAYANAVAGQAQDDLTAGRLVWASVSAGEIARALASTFVFPWGNAALAAFALVMAGVGAIALLRSRAWRELATMALLWGPYAGFHFVAQEPSTVRYALPLVVAVAYLAARGIMALPRRAALATAAAAIVATGASSIRVLAIEAAAGSPLYSLAQDMTATGQRQKERPLVLAHFGAGIALQRVESLMGGRAPWRAQRPPRTHEWLQIADAWKGDPPSRVWFVAHPLRTDLALVDPSSVRLLRQDRHPDAVRWLVTGLRPEALDWYEITRPNWIALRGWALTPETAGTATRDGRGLDVGPISALVRPLGEPALLLLGGRHLGEAGAPPARVTIQFGDTPLDSFDVAASPREFLRFVEVPRRSAAPQYVPLTITAATSGRSTAPVAIEQFDYQPASSVIAGFGRGWHEPELDPRRGLQWRWTSAEADLHIRAQGDVRVTVAGESPLRYFDSPARLRLRAAGLDVGERSLAADYREAFCIPHQLLKASSGRLTLATDLTFVPRDRDGSADARTLGLRVFDVKVVPANCGSRPAR